ncbi:MAG: small subunit ribosomal protein S20 [Alteromonas naphthalenivorans]|jgi:small subunit ribosomal protein S20
MANIKSSKKRARQMLGRRQKNLARTSSIKTVVKKVLDAVKAKDHAASVVFLKDAESQMSRAKGKHVMHAKTASRKIGRLAKKVSALAKEAKPVVKKAAPKKKVAEVSK